MHSELKSIQDQKDYLQKRLDQMNKKVKKTRKIKNERTEPWNNNKFLLYNKKKKSNKSTLVDQGLMRPSSKNKSTWGLRGARSGLLHNKRTWGQKKPFYSTRSNFKRSKSKDSIHELT
jgi:hypothetical protein